MDYSQQHPDKENKTFSFFKPIHFHNFILTVNLRDSTSYLVTNISGSGEIRSGPTSPRNEGDVLFDKENGNNICSLSHRRIIRLSCIIRVVMCSSKGRWSFVLQHNILILRKGKCQFLLKENQRFLVFSPPQSPCSSAHIVYDKRVCHLSRFGRCMAMR